MRAIHACCMSKCKMWKRQRTGNLLIINWQVKFSRIGTGTGADTIITPSPYTHNFSHLKCQPCDGKRPSLTFFIFHDIQWPSMSYMTFYDLLLPSMTFYDLLWPFITFYHLLRPLWPSMIKCLLPRPGPVEYQDHSKNQSPN